MTGENKERDITNMSVPEILKFINDVLEQYVSNSLAKLKSQAMLKEIQKRINYLWGTEGVINFKVQRHCHNCGSYEHCKPFVDNTSCPFWQPNASKRII